jgi:Zn-dependent metalloprotease
MRTNRSNLPSAATLLLQPLIGFALAASASAAPATAGKNLPTDARVRFDDARKTVSSIEGSDLLSSRSEIAALAKIDAASAAIAFVAANRELFGLTEPANELKLIAVQSDDLGYHHVKLRQTYRDLDVVSAQIVVHFDRGNALYLVNNSCIASPALDLKPKVDAAAATARVASDLNARTGAAVLKIYPGNGSGVLCYEISASAGPTRAWRVYVDANTGSILDKILTVQTSSSSAPQANRSPAPSTL